MKRHVSNEARCPFYRSEDAYRIVCEGIIEDSSVHVVFQSSTQKTKFSKRFCCGDYETCMISHMLYAKYRDNGA